MGQVGLGFRTVYCGVGCWINQDIWLSGLNQFAQGSGLSQVAVGRSNSYDLMLGIAKRDG